MSDAFDAIGKLSAICEKLPPALQQRASDELERVAKTLTREMQTAQVCQRLEEIGLFAERPDAREVAIDYFTRNYSDIVETGAFYADDLLYHDRALYKALGVHLAKRGRSLADVMPIRPTYRPGRRGTNQAVRLAKAS